MTDDAHVRARANGEEGEMQMRNANVTGASAL
jgi:hypothetical protein